MALTSHVGLFFGLAFALRVILIFYGTWHDKVMEVPFTDVDYSVFSDAAKHVANGSSPYRRDTYRYTPLLSWLLVPNHKWLEYAEFGKFLFVTFDLLCALLHWSLLNMDKGKETEQTLRFRLLCCATWLFNPITMTVSSRGNAESIIGAVVLSALLLLRLDRPATAGILYGLAVHLKVYPLVYGPAIYLWLSLRQKPVVGSGIKLFWQLLMPTRAHVLFGMFSFGILAWLTQIFYRLYGWEFLEETYFYHIKRSDTQHNFSAYFYPMWLVETYMRHLPIVKKIFSLTAFMPQVFMTAGLSWQYKHDLTFATAMLTFSFVTFNKVCTSQYFLWYLVLLPLVIPRISVACTTGNGRRNTIALTMAWFAAQGVWLGSAYLLEFRRWRVAPLVWGCSLLFLFVNCVILRALLMAYRRPRQKTC